MKTKNVSSLLLAATLACGTLTAFAEPVTTTFSEKFNSTELDPARWFRYQGGAGKLTVKNSKLNFLVPNKPTSGDLGSIEWLAQYPTFSDKWETTIALVNNSELGQNAGCGLMIAHSEERKNYMYIDFYGKAGVAGGVYANGNKVKGGIAKQSPWNKGYLRIQYADKVMSLSISPNGKPGTWIKAGTFSPTAKSAGAKALLYANWNMKPADRFAIQLFGFSHNKKVPAGKITLDNFGLSITTPDSVP